MTVTSGSRGGLTRGGIRAGSGLHPDSPEAAMRNTDLFQQALGLLPPWLVEAARFDAERKRLDLDIDFAKGGRFPCPDCGTADCPTHDTSPKTWRHLDFFQHQAFLNARVPRIKCPDCGVKQVAVPWARPGSGFTLLPASEPGSKPWP